jgi:hypothetical protein
VNRNTAGSGWGWATTGGTFMMRLCSPSTSYRHVKSGLTRALNQPVPQIATITDRMIHGTQAITISRWEAWRSTAAEAAGRGGA